MQMILGNSKPDKMQKIVTQKLYKIEEEEVSERYWINYYNLFRWKIDLNNIILKNINKDINIQSKFKI